MILEYTLSSSKVGFVQLRVLTKRPHIAYPISDARHVGFLDMRCDLVVDLSNAAGVKIHRSADAHFEGRKDITWVHLTIGHSLTGTTINTDIPIISCAAEEHRTWVEGPTKQEKELSSWLETLVEDM